MAAVCLAFHMTPSEYRSLTVAEHAALVEALKEQSNGR